MKIELSGDQRTVLREVWKWFVDQKRPYLTFGGYAGTGKTTMMALLRNAIKERFPKQTVAFCSYTGKAARVLEYTLKEHQARYPKDTTGTIHSLIYEPRVDQKGRVTSWQKKKQLEVDLIVVDEASMVDRQIWNDLQSFDIPILAVGDHGQLPPIHGNFNLMESPDLRLEKIHRQAQGNPIIRLSEKVRHGEEIPYGDFGLVKKFRAKGWETREVVEEILRDFNEELLVLVGYNWSRVELNRFTRELNNMYSEGPQAGDCVICLKNNHKKGIYNGMRGRVLKVSPQTDKKRKGLWYHLEAEMDSGQNYQGKVLKEQFNSKKTIQKVGELRHKEIGDLFDFGYALTVHKAQGSQAKKVLLFEQRFSKMDDEQWQRWLYTAVTRAEEELVIVS